MAALKEKYQTVEALNTAWNTKFNDFDDLYQPIRDASAKSEAAKEDQKTFSKEMLRAYVEIPSKACREVDPNHMILGMRWAWISDPDLATWDGRILMYFPLTVMQSMPTEAISACGRAWCRSACYDWRISFWSTRYRFISNRT